MRYLFENCTLDTKRRELRRGARLVDLEPQVFDLIEFLIRARDRVASRDDLLEAVWKGRIVSESTLSSRINAARVAIGDNGTTQRLIRTLPRKGIRFVGEVQEEAPSPAVAPLRGADAPTGSAIAFGTAGRNEPAIAVLAFDNMGPDEEAEYFADGMAEEIITALARCSGIAVIARNSSFSYKGRAVDVRQIGRELGVGYVLEGSVRRSNDRVRITVQLIDATTGAHLWADRFEGKLSDVFELQDRIAESAAAVIEPRLRAAESERVRRKPPQSPDAYDLWLRSIWLANEFTAEAMASAQQCISQALEIDPSYSLAMATAGFFHAQSFLHRWVENPEAAKVEGMQLALRAIDLASTDSNVQWMSGFAIWVFGLDVQRARELFRQSLQTNPNSALALTMAGWVEAVNGNPAEGRKMVERALHLDPRHPHGWLMSIGMALNEVADKRFEEAVCWADRALVQNRRSVVAMRALVVALVNTGSMGRAKSVVRDILAIEPELTIARWRMTVAVADEDLKRTYADALSKAGIPD